MALDFPNAPTNGQVYTVTGTGEQWIYEAATNSWTSKGLVNSAGGLQYKGDIDITAAPPTGATSGSQYSVNPGGTANAGFGPGVTGTITKGSMLMYTGTGWIETNHAVPEATATVKGIDTRKWNRTGTVLSPATAGDVVNISAGTAALPGLTPVGDPNTGIYSPGADQVAVSTNGKQRITVDANGRFLVGTSSARTGWNNTGPGVVTPFIQLDGTDVNNSTISVARNTTGPTDDGRILLGRSRGTTAGSFALVASNDALGQVSFQGADGSELVEAASIRAEVDGTPGADDMPGRIVLSTTAAGANTPTPRMTIDSAGNILIGQTSTATPGRANTTLGMGLHGTGDAYFSHNSIIGINKNSDGVSVVFSKSGADVGNITVNATATHYNTGSDYRLKENVVAVPDGITRLQQLKPSRFNFIADPGHTVDGFIAHEVQSVVPEAVTGAKDAVDADGNPVYQGIDQSKVVPLVVAALQECIKKVEALESELALLKSKP